MDLRSEPTRVLDIATGTGYVARRIKERYPSAEVIGVDVSPEMVAVAEENAAEEGLDIEFRTGDAADLPFPADTFDLVVMQNALPFVDEMLRVTEPRGRALLVFSVAGPWVSLVWPTIASSFEKAGAAHLRTRRIAYGFFALARKRG
jgi:ubiquinone/menaquinone biosynthesis C-methylase UbiE